MLTQLLYFLYFLSTPFMRNAPCVIFPIVFFSGNLQLNFYWYIMLGLGSVNRYTLLIIWLQFKTGKKKLRWKLDCDQNAMSFLQSKSDPKKSFPIMFQPMQKAANRQVIDKIKALELIKSVFIFRTTCHSKFQLTNKN